MRALDKARLLLRSLIRRSEVERELDEEFRFHLDQLVEEKNDGVVAERLRMMRHHRKAGIEIDEVAPATRHFEEASDQIADETRAFF